MNGSALIVLIGRGSLSTSKILRFLGVIRRAALLCTRLLPSYRGGDYVLLGELCLLGSFGEVPQILFLCSRT